VKSHAMKYVKAEVIRRTVFAGLMSALSPIALLKIGELIGKLTTCLKKTTYNLQIIRG
jgi:hypothetical protein